jgi:hypothetical protein
VNRIATTGPHDAAIYPVVIAGNATRFSISICCCTGVLCPEHAGALDRLLIPEANASLRDVGVAGHASGQGPQGAGRTRS